MIKKYIQTFIFCFLLNIICIINVNATNLDIVEPGDIIIGNTVFRSDDWISATRSSKAGALYYENTGETDVRVFYYDDLGDWYEYNDSTSKYELIIEPTLSELEDIINIYYDNNIAILHNYDYPYDYSLYLSNGEIRRVSSNNVTFKDTYISCPYGEWFEFDFYNFDIYERETYEGFCGFDGNFEFWLKDDSFYSNLNIMKITKGYGTNNDSNILNVYYEKEDLLNDNNLIQISVLDTLQNSSEGYDFGEGKFIALNIKFDNNYDNNEDTTLSDVSGKTYNIYSSSNVNYSVNEYGIIGQFTLYLDLSSFEDSADFVIIDEHGNYETITIRYALFNEDNYISADVESIEYFDIYNIIHTSTEYLYNPDKLHYRDEGFGSLYFDEITHRLYYSNDLIDNNSSEHMYFYDGASVNVMYYSNTLIHEEIIASVIVDNGYGPLIMLLDAGTYTNASAFVNFKKGTSLGDNYLNQENVSVYYFKSYENMNEEEKAEIDYLEGLDNVNLIDYSSYFNEM